MPTISCGGLHQRTLDLLDRRHRKLTYQRMADETGLTLAWIRQFARGPEAMSDPGVSKVEKLHDFLVECEARFYGREV
jgi:transcriptional regulator with XRE-family HTH domain